ncbi:CST complex subunit CTC1 isoform X2 [Ananas comosus]|uniref:CST complex subunit CTC1 n=1 Tax=Ananas comosus TaxID=4615 RepID=A0A6P5EHV9_ANACO|nr:CST complex subunit CTC1 isoform X2 [Ananas comosus]
MEGAHVLSLSDLLRASRPLTGASSLVSVPTSPRPPPTKRSRVETLNLDHTTNPLLFSDLSPNPNPNPNAFLPIKRPVLLIGTVDLLPPDSDRCRGCENHCLSFSGGSSRVCCYVLDFDPEILRREIAVLAWNFLPFDRETGVGGGGGVLEVIRWRFTGPATAFDGGFLLSALSIGSHQETNSVVRSRKIGVVRSISLVFKVPYATQHDGGDSVGFLAEILSCECDSCSSALMRQGTDNCFVGGNDVHKFTKPVFVYFLNPLYTWRPVLSKMIGKLVVLSGLKKKLVFVGEESYTMFVSTGRTTLSLRGLSTGTLPSGGMTAKDGECNNSVYSGTITGIYMQGMVVELDQKVFLLINDPQLAPHHSFRSGAIVSVRNFHLVRPNFASIKMVLLCTCVKTNIDVESFSLIETKCHLKIQSKSLLGKFINSLTFSARFWVLLLVSSFKQKFQSVCSEMEILGSNNKEGLVQTYASRWLSPNDYQPKHGIFMEFCKHDSCMYNSESDLKSLKLVIPLSNLISKCEEIWVSFILKRQKDAEKGGLRHNLSHFIHEGTSCRRFIRRIIPSEDLGFILLGSIKTSSPSGRLQLVDATGNIDVVIPDLVSNVNCHNIYEIREYKLVLEGSPTQLDNQQYDFGPLLTCRAIFQQFSCRKRLNNITISASLHGTLMPARVHRSDGNCFKDSVDGQHNMRILLEFKADSFIYYQLLRIGGYYLLKCSSDGLTCNLKGCECFACGKTCIDSQNTLRSVSIIFNGCNNHKGSREEHTSEVSSGRAGEPRSHYATELLLSSPLEHFHETSDFHLDLLNEEHLLGILPRPSEVLSVSSCIRMMTAEFRTTGISDLQGHWLPQGDLVSLNGNIEDVHLNDCKSTSFVSFRFLTGSDQRRISSVCIHVADDTCVVQISGHLSMRACPVGFRPGVKATFHRVLMMCSSSGRHALLFTPVTFIEINSIREVVDEQSEERMVLPTRLTFPTEHLSDTIPLGLFLQLVRSMDSKLTKVRCRVVTTQFLVLEHCGHDSMNSEQCRLCSIPKVNIPIAGFVMDDGLSLCCCWADRDRAGMLLRLQENAKYVFSDAKVFKGGGNTGNLQHTVGYHLQKMLKKHGRVIVKNHGIAAELSCQDLTFSCDSDKHFSSSEERLLKFIILNACQGSVLNIVGSALDANTLRWLDKELLELSTGVQSMHNAWVSEVEYVDPLKEAWTMLHNLGIK